MKSFRFLIFAAVFLLWAVNTIKLNHEGKPSKEIDDQFEEFKKKYNREYSGK